MSTNLVNTDWLAENLDNPNVVVLDASMESIQGDNIVTTKYIPGARIFDIKKDFSDQNSHFPHTVPSLIQFTEGMQKLGIDRDTIIVFYDTKGIYSSPRAWWLCKLFGHQKTFVLDGGLPKWLSEQKPVSQEPEIVTIFSSWSGTLDPTLICDKASMLGLPKSDDDKIIDARSRERFLGMVPEPRKGLKSGHIPRAINIPFTSVLNNSCYRQPHELQTLFKAQGITADSSTYFYCGSGVTASIVLLAAVEAGIKRVSLYDGSWAEWGLSAD